MMITMTTHPAPPFMARFEDFGGTGLQTMSQDLLSGCPPIALFSFLRVVSGRARAAIKQPMTQRTQLMDSRHTFFSNTELCDPTLVDLVLWHPVCPSFSAEYTNI